MLYAYAVRFDVTKNLKKFLIFEVNGLSQKASASEKGSVRREHCFCSASQPTSSPSCPPNPN
jgi:hypothetical protein